MPEATVEELGKVAQKLIIMGRPKVGKTFCAATASKYWQPEGRSLDLKDMYWMLFDPGGLRGFASQKIKTNVWDFTTIEAQTLAKELQLCYRKIKQAVKEGEVRTVVVDTVSMMDILAQQYAIDIGLDKYKKWEAVLNIHRATASVLMGLGVDIIYLAHPKEETVEEEKKAIKQEVSGIAGGGDVVVDVSGKAARYYKATADLICTLQAKKVRGKGLERKLIAGTNFIEGGTRYDRFNEQGEPADLGALFAKLTKE